VSLFLSLIGLGLLPFLFLNSPPMIVIPWQNHLIGIAFTTICILGIIAGISPSHCRLSSQKKQTQGEYREPPTQTKDKFPPIEKRGHHPTCTPYASHVFSFRKKVYCAGCTGLVTGAIIALIGTTSFFFFGVKLIFPEIIFWLGFVFVGIGLLQHPFYRLFKLRHGRVRVIINALFVIGSFLILTSTVQLTNNILFSIYLLLLICYWIFTRIVMSRWAHQRICAQCKIPGCPLRES
ncbi:MAG: hypothetical protein ACFFBU_04180, partial [Promethearchaeota archaeon]